MSIVSSELVLYTSVNMPTSDTGTSGGQIETVNKSRPVFSTAQMASNTTLEVASDGTADGAKFVRITGRNAAGSIVTEDIALSASSGTYRNGATTFERILKAQMYLVSGSTQSSATGTVMVRASADSPIFGYIYPGESAFQLLFYDAASSTTASAVRYEKIYAKNNNGSLGLTNATIACTADPDAVIEWGYATASAQSIANRTPTAPVGPTFLTDGAAYAVPQVTGEIAASAVIGAGEAAGIWIKQNLAQNNAALKSTFTLQIVGTST